MTVPSAGSDENQEQLGRAQEREAPGSREDGQADRSIRRRTPTA